MLVWTGLTEIATALQPGQRDPCDLRPTGVGREMRGYVTQGLEPALAGYHQRDGGGSDHQALKFTFRFTGQIHEAHSALPARRQP